MRRVEGKRQSKFMQIVSAPIKVLSKARDLYMMCMYDCAGKMSYTGVAACPMAQVVPSKSYSAIARYSYNASDNDGEKLSTKLISGASSRNVESKVKVHGGQKAMGRSYGVGVGKIGRIDEDKPCAFEEEGFNPNLIYPRTTRSYALKRNFVLQ